MQYHASVLHGQIDVYDSLAIRRHLSGGLGSSRNPANWLPCWITSTSRSLRLSLAFAEGNWHLFTNKQINKKGDIFLKPYEQGRY